MAEERDWPYSVFNYLVDLGGGDGNAGSRAGFQEVTGLGIEITMQEYRAGNDTRNAPIKIPGMHKVSDVSLKRGLIAADDLVQWMSLTQQGKDARRQVTIELRSEDHTTTVMTWVLEGAQPLKYTGPSFNGKGTDIGIEELVLSVQAIKVE